MFVKKIQLRNFKSFKHADIEMDKAFNVIVGPNGSGKSNIIDSLLFAFGESSFKSMRVKKTPDLIYGDHKVADVVVELADTTTGKTHTVQRMIRRDGKMKYSLDGKRAKKYVVEDFLLAHRLSLANIIKQGEVQRIVEMNPKDRRAMIDAVANVSDYEKKKEEAFGELGKVDEKLNEATVVLGEREGMLEDLEKEKADAEKYVGLKKEHDSLKATILSINERQLEGEFTELIKSLGDSGSRISEIDAKLRELDAKIAEIVAEKDKLNKEITDKGAGKELELQREIDALSSNISFAEKTADEKKAEAGKAGEKLTQLTNERRRADDEVKGANARLKDAEAELAEVERQLKEAEKELDGMTRASSEYSAQYHEAKKTLQKCEDEMAAAKEQLNDLMVKSSTFQETARLKEDALERLRRGVFDEGTEQRKKGIAEKKREAQRALAEVEGENSRLFAKEKELNARLPALEDILMAAKEGKAEVAARLKHVHEREKPTEALKDIKGVYGTLEQLCSYEPAHAVPIQVAIGPRMDFLVVDSVRTASECIERVRNLRTGRVSFIPLDRINAPAIGAEAKRLASSKGSMGFVIDFVKFDPRFDRAFRYACGDTLLMDSLKSMEPLVGKIRMVSVGGDLADASGLMTGGRVPDRVTAARDRALYDEWEAKVQSATEERRQILDDLNGLRDRLGEARKKRADAQVALKAAEIEEEHLHAEEAKTLAARKDTAAAIKTMEAEISAVRKQSSDVDEKRSQLVRRLSEINIAKLDASQKVDVEKEQKFGIAVKEKEKRVSELRIMKNDYSNRIHLSRTQAEVYEKQASGLAAEEKELKASVDGADAIVKKAHADVREWKAQREKKSAEQKSVSNAFKELIEKRDAMDKSIQKIGNEEGHLKLERERVDGASRKSENRKAALEVQLSSAKAELAAFEGAVIIEGKTEKDKPALIAKASEAETKLKDIGNVNMLAIEEYSRKSAELAEHKKKVQQLVDEKQAVISIITEIEQKKIATFMAAFNVVDENFGKLFTNVFTGKGRLLLENPANPFEGGLTIEVQLENKEIKYLEIMSGGEKSLIALMFLFAIQAQNPSSIYVLDEADAALDQENSRKLSLLLKQLSKGSQFMAVSHNETLFKSADCLVGISMTKEGSKPVEVKLTDLATT